METRRILLVEDHASFRQTLAFVLAREREFEVIGEAGSLAEAREVWRNLEDGVDLAVVDLSLPDGEGVELIAEWRETNPDFTMLVLTASLERIDEARAVEAGAAGVVHKSAGVEEILGALRRLAAGEPLLEPEDLIGLLRFAGRAREEERETLTNIEKLTRREREVLQGLAEGLSNKEIARTLHISVETERSHMMSILNKLEAHSRLQALILAARHGIVELR